MIKRPMLLAATAFAVAIAAYRFSGFWIFLSVVLFCAAFVVFLNRSFLNIALFGLLFICLVISVASNGGRISAARELNGKRFTACFVVCGEEMSKSSPCVNVKSVGNSFIADNMRFALYSDEELFKCGERVTVSVTCLEADEATFDNMIFSDIYGRLWLDDVISVDGSDLFYTVVGKTRDAVRAHFAEGLSYDSFATVIAVMLGDKSYLSQIFYENVKNAGVSHIMAVSGLHISVIMGIAFMLIRQIIRQKHIRFLVICGFIVFVSAVCGFRPSVVRAGTMFVLFAVPPLFGRDADSPSVLCLSVVLILLFKPFVLFNISFLMSVSAVVAVMLVAPFYTALLIKALGLRKGLVSGILEILSVSVFAQIFTAPFSIYTFKSFSLVAPLTNLFISLAVTAVLQLGFASLLFKFIPLISGYLLFAVERFTGYINYLITAFGGFKYAAFAVDPAVCIIPAVMSVALIAGMYALKRRNAYAV